MKDTLGVLDDKACLCRILLIEKRNCFFAYFRLKDQKEDDEKQKV